MVPDIRPRADGHGKSLHDFRPPKRSFPSPRILMGPAAPRRTDECLLHAVTRRSRRPDGRSELSAEALPSAKPPGVARPFYRLRGTGSHLFASIRPPRFAVEPRCRIYFLRLTFVAFQSRQTPSITRPRSLLAAHDVHQGSRRKIGPRRNQRPSPNVSRRCVRWTNPSLAGLELCFCSLSLLASV